MATTPRATPAELSPAEWSDALAVALDHCGPPILRAAQKVGRVGADDPGQRAYVSLCNRIRDAGRDGGLTLYPDQIAQLEAMGASATFGVQAFGVQLLHALTEALAGRPVELSTVIHQFTVRSELRRLRDAGAGLEESGSDFRERNALQAGVRALVAIGFLELDDIHRGQPVELTWGDFHRYARTTGAQLVQAVDQHTDTGDATRLRAVLGDIVARYGKPALAALVPAAVAPPTATLPSLTTQPPWLDGLFDLSSGSVSASATRQGGHSTVFEDARGRSISIVLLPDGRPEVSVGDLAKRAGPGGPVSLDAHPELAAELLAFVRGDPRLAPNALPDTAAGWISVRDRLASALEPYAARPVDWR